MLKNCDESDFYELKIIASERLRPDGISVFFWGAFVLSGIMTAVAAFGISQSVQNINPIWNKIININLFFLLIQLLLTMFFTSEKNAFKFQRFQAILLSVISFKISIEMYNFFFIACQDKNAPSYITNAGMFLLLGGITYLILSTIRGIGRVKKGEFRKGGKLLYDFQNSKGYVSIPIIYGVTMIGGTITKIFSDTTSITAKLLELIFILLITTFIQYGISMAWPEFFLLTYCKFRFKSFNLKIPESFKERRK